MPNGSHGLPPSRPQSICNFTLAGDAYSVSSRTVRSLQVAPWLSAGPSAHNAYPSPDAQAASPVIPTVIVSASYRLSLGANRAIATMTRGADLTFATPPNCSFDSNIRKSVRRAGMRMLESDHWYAIRA
jgi:hypothetical protein